MFVELWSVWILGIVVCEGIEVDLFFVFLDEIGLWIYLVWYRYYVVNWPSGLRRQFKALV